MIAVQTVRLILNLAIKLPVDAKSLALVVVHKPLEGCTIFGNYTVSILSRIVIIAGVGTILPCRSGSRFQDVVYLREQLGTLFNTELVVEGMIGPSKVDAVSLGKEPLLVSPYLVCRAISIQDTMLGIKLQGIYAGAQN